MKKLILILPFLLCACHDKKCDREYNLQQRADIYKACLTTIKEVKVPAEDYSWYFEKCNKIAIEQSVVKETCIDK